MVAIPTQAAALGLLEAPVNLRAAVVAGTGEDSFKSLLGVSTTPAAKEARGADGENAPRDEKKDAPAAAVDARAIEPRKTNNSNEAEEVRQTDDAAPAGRARENRLPRQAEKLVDAPRESADEAVPAAEKSAETESKSQVPGDVDAEEAPVPADASAEVAPAVALSGQIEALRDVLALLQSVGGDPKQAIVKIEAVLARVTTVSLTVNNVPGGQEVPGVTATDVDGKNLSLTELLSDVKSQLGTLQDVLDKISPETRPSDIRPAFTALAQKINALTGFLAEQPVVAAENPGLKEDIMAAARGFLSAIKDTMAKNYAARDTKPVAQPLPDAAISPRAQADARVVAEAAAPVQPTGITITSGNSHTAIVASAVSSAQTAASNDNAGGQGAGREGSQQSLPQAVAGARAPSQAAATQAAGSSDFTRLLQQARVPVAEQVAFQIKTNLTSGDSKITIQLDPEELGRVEIKLDVKSDGKTGVTITADYRSTLDLLQRDTRGLERALSDAGLKADSGSLSFNLRGGQQEQNQNGGLPFAQSYRKAQPEEAELLPVSVVTRSYTLGVAGGLDITI